MQISIATTRPQNLLQFVLMPAVLKTLTCHNFTSNTGSDISGRHQKTSSWVSACNSVGKWWFPMPPPIRQQKSFQIMWRDLEEAELIELIESLIATWQAEDTVTDSITCKTDCSQQATVTAVFCHRWIAQKPEKEHVLLASVYHKTQKDKMLYFEWFSYGYAH